jgi:type I restriction enzyme S subunit
MSKWPKTRLSEIVTDLTDARTFQASDDDDITDPTIRSATHTIGIAGNSKGCDVKVRKRVRIYPGDIVFSRLHTQNGAFALSDNYFQATGTFIPLSVNENKIDRRFLFWALDQFVPSLSASDTVGRETFKTQDILALEIPLPSLDEQRRVAARIEELAAQIDDASCLRQQSVEETVAFFQQSLAQLFDSVESTIQLGNVCETTSGGTPSRCRPDFFDGDIPWIKSGELEDNVISRAEEHISQHALRESSAKLFPQGTLLVALYGATVGKTGVLGMDAATNQAVCALFPKPNLDRYYLWWFLRRMRPVFVDGSFGGAQPNISQKTLRETVIPLPSLADQRRIVKRLVGLQAEVDMLKHLQADTTAKLDALLPSILDKAFKGEL